MLPTLVRRFWPKRKFDLVEFEILDMKIKCSNSECQIMIGEKYDDGEEK